MFVRLRLATTTDALFCAPILKSMLSDRVLDIGDHYIDQGCSYRVIKVLQDVDPEYGESNRGPVVYLVRIVQEAPKQGATRHLYPGTSFFTNPAQCLKNCMARANSARRTGNSEDYRKHIEEFLFLSHAAAKDLGTFLDKAKAQALPLLIVYSKNDESVRRMRDGFIIAGFASQVIAVRSIENLRTILDKLDNNRVTVLIVSESIALKHGLDAFQEFRGRCMSASHPVLVLTQNDSPLESELSIAAGATATARFPTKISEYPDLVKQIRSLMIHMTSKAATAGSFETMG